MGATLQVGLLGLLLVLGGSSGGRGAVLDRGQAASHLLAVNIVLGLLILGGGRRDHGLHLGLLSRLGGRLPLLLLGCYCGLGLFHNSSDRSFDGFRGVAIGVIPAKAACYNEQESPAKVRVHSHDALPDQSRRFKLPVFRAHVPF